MQVNKGEFGTDTAYLLPRYTTTDRVNFIPSSEALVYDITEQAVYLWNGATWVNLTQAISLLTNLNLAVNKQTIALHDNGTTVTSIEETITDVTDLSFDTNTRLCSLSYRQENENVSSRSFTLPYYTYFPIWAEENGPLASNTNEWSYGNGATGVNIGIVLPFDCEITHMTMNAETAGTSVGMNILNNSAVADTVTFTGANDVVTLATPIQFTAGQRYNIQTGVETGAYTDVRVCAWFRGIVPF